MKMEHRPFSNQPRRSAVRPLPGLFVMVLLSQNCVAGNFYAGTSPSNVPWTNGIVPYAFDTNTLTGAQQQTCLDGLREWELAAGVKFVPHTNQARWILFAYNTNGFDNVSSGYNPQVVTVDNLSRAQVCHEMGHSFGFTHENIRPDATNFISVLTNNIANEPTNIFWFTIDPASVTNGNYDFESVMHLGWDFASAQPGVLATQQPKPPYFPRYQFRLGNATISPGDRAALRFLYGPPIVALTNVVTTTADAGPGSLRAAMYYVTDNPGAIVRFNIPTSDPGYSNGVFTIHLTGQLPTLVSNAMVVDGSTQPGFTNKPVIIVDGSQILPDPRNANTGLLLYSANNQVKNISFQGFNWNGLTLEYADATNNTIAGCWLGIDYTGSNAAPNAYQGILIANGASRNIIGGTNALACNVISGNGQYGIWMSDTNTTANVVLGNYIGTDASGSFAVANAFGGIGIFSNGVGHVIGGTNALARNVISGNISAGIWLSGAGVSNNTVQGNFIGLDATGTTAISNTFAGVYVINGARSNAILNNVISGNFSEGLRLSDTGTTANLVQGNFIGTDATGTSAVPNGFLGLSLYSGAISNTIGGTTSTARNVISGNGSEGLRIQGVGASWNLIEGNFIGSDVTGMNPLANNFAGLTIYSGATSNTIGNTIAGARNVISGNAGQGIAIGDPGTSGNLILGNYIGVASNGTSALQNGGIGINIEGGPQGNTIGGIVAGAPNLIAANGGDGIQFYNTSSNLVQGNFVGTDKTGLNALGNGGSALSIFASSSFNTIGGTTVAARNLFSASTNGDGVYISDAGTVGNILQGNSIGTDITGNAPLGNGGEGVFVGNGAQDNLVGGTAAGAGNVIVASQYRGIYLGGPGTSGNVIQGNNIGLGANGSTAMGNGYEAIELVNGASGNLIGGTSPGARNLLSANGTRAFWISDTATSGNLIEGNYIGVAADGVTARGNQWEGIIIINGASGNIIGLDKTGAGAANLIANNGYEGVALYSTNTAGNTIRGNTIFNNGKLGINLASGSEDGFGVTANHSGGPVVGPNDLQNFPALASVSAYPGSTIIGGTLNGAPGRSYLVDVYWNATADPSGHGEGQLYVGSANLNTDGGGHGSFTLTTSSNLAGKSFAATATDTTTGDTSEFSADVTDTSGPPQFVGPYTFSGGSGFSLNFMLQTNLHYRIQATTNLGMQPIPWIDLTNFTANSSPLQFTDPSATNRPTRFYRIVSP